MLATLEGAPPEVSPTWHQTGLEQSLAWVIPLTAVKGDPIPHELPSEDRLGAEAELGSRVRVRDAHGEEEYTIVRRGEAEPARGRISTESPVGRALLGGRRGDAVRVQTPGGVRELTIVEVAPPRCCPMEE
jgi:hypothetical protein